MSTGDDARADEARGEASVALDAVAEAKARKRARQVAWAVRGGLVVLRALAATWRVREHNARAYRDLSARGQPFVFAFWHFQLLPLVWWHRGQGVSVLISIHKDGEIIARVAEALGLNTVRGSTTTGAARALMALARELQSGRSIAVTPDGPRGPAEKFAPGALVAAQRAKAPLVPIAVHASRAWRLRSWDRFMIPKPFSRVTIVYGEPAYVEATDARGAAAEADRFEAILGALATETARVAGTRG